MSAQYNGSPSICCDMLQCVRAFHNHVGAPVCDVPRLLDCDQDAAARLANEIRKLIAKSANTSPDPLTLRANLSLEELAEWLEAHVAGELIAVADAWADRAYVLFGDAVESGLPATQLFQEVHRSNMSKSAVGRSGKGIKGESYEPPNLGPILNY